MSKQKPATPPVSSKPVATAKPATPPASSTPVATAKPATPPASNIPIGITKPATPPASNIPIGITKPATPPASSTPVATTKPVTPPASNTPVARPTTDTTAPLAPRISPTKDGKNVSVDANLVIEFNELIKIGTGKIKIVSNSSEREIWVNDTRKVTIDGKILTINLAQDLAYDTEYHVLIDSTAITDLADNNYRGINDNASWRFKTVAKQATTTPTPSNTPVTTSTTPLASNGVPINLNTNPVTTNPSPEPVKTSNVILLSAKEPIITKPPLPTVTLNSSSSEETEGNTKLVYTFTRTDSENKPLSKTLRVFFTVGGSWDLPKLQVSGDGYDSNYISTPYVS